MFLGTNEKAISKVDYEKRITEWLVSSANGGMKRNGNYSKLEIKVVQDGSINETGYSIPFAQNEALLEFRNSVLSAGYTLIQQIEAIKLLRFEHLRESEPFETEKI